MSGTSEKMPDSDDHRLSLLDATLESTADAIATFDNSGRPVLYNSKFLELWKIQRDTLKTGQKRDVLEGILGCVEDREAFAGIVDRMDANPEAHITGRIKLLDGRTLELSSWSLVIDGKIAGRAWNFHDITDLKQAADESRRLLSLLDGTLEATADAIMVADNSGRMIRYNRKFASMWGLPDEVLASGDLKRMLQIEVNQLKDPESFTRRVAEIYAKPEAQSFEIVEFRDGRVIEYYSQPLQANNCISGRVWSFRDVTERKLAEEVLRHDESRLNTLLNIYNMTDVSKKELIDYCLENGVEITRSKIGYLAFLNEDESVLTMYSWSKTAMAECAIADRTMIYPVATTGLWGDAVRGRKPVITNDYDAAGASRKGYPPGHVRIVRHMNVPVFEGERIVMVAGVGNKETDYDDADVRQLTLLMQGMWQMIMRKKVGDALRESEARFRSFIQQASEGFILVDEKGIIIEYNDAAEKIYGYTREEMIGSHLADHIYRMTPEKDREKLHSAQIRRSIERYLSTGVRTASSGKYESEALCKDGTCKYIEAFDFPIRTIRGFMIGNVITDITERKKAEERLKASLHEKEVMLKEIHHRVKNNLQIVSSMINLQSRQVDDPEYAALFMDSQNRIRTMALIHEKLYKSSDLASIDFGEYIRNLTSFLMKSYAPRQFINIDVNASGIYLGVDQAIPCSLVINELVSNCFKYAFPGGRNGTIRVSMEVAGSDYVLKVSDDGAGIPADIDYQNTTSLGLQLVNTLVGQLEGDISLDREHGTAFTIRFKK